MIEKFVNAFISNQEALRAEFAKTHPESYKLLVTEVIRVLSNALDDLCKYEIPDPDRVHEIDDGEYQGTLLYVIAAQEYQPNRYWAVKVEYGSCSGCDTLQAIRDSNYENVPTEDQIKEYMILALHIIQGLKEIK